MALLIVETTFLIDLEREVARQQDGPAQRFLDQHAQDLLCIDPTIAGELAAGPRVVERADWQAFIGPFRILEHNREVCWQYGRIYDFLRANGLLIGANDLWVTATSLAYDMPLVTRNVKHFQRIPGLSMISYANHP